MTRVTFRRWNHLAWAWAWAWAEGEVCLFVDRLAGSSGVGMEKELRRLWMGDIIGFLLSVRCSLSSSMVFDAFDLHDAMLPE